MDKIFEVIKKHTQLEITEDTAFSKFTTSMGILEILLELEELGYKTMSIEASSLLIIKDMIQAIKNNSKG